MVKGSDGEHSRRASIRAGSTRLLSIAGETTCLVHVCGSETALYASYSFIFPCLAQYIDCRRVRTLSTVFCEFSLELEPRLGDFRTVDGWYSV